MKTYIVKWKSSHTGKTVAACVRAESADKAIPQRKGVPIQGEIISVEPFTRRADYKDLALSNAAKGSELAMARKEVARLEQIEWLRQEKVFRLQQVKFRSQCLDPISYIIAVLRQTYRDLERRDPLYTGPIFQSGISHRYGGGTSPQVTTRMGKSHLIPSLTSSSGY
jgi:hypothetical protein